MMWNGYAVYAVYVVYVVYTVDVIYVEYTVNVVYVVYVIYTVSRLQTLWSVIMYLYIYIYTRLSTRLFTRLFIYSSMYWLIDGLTYLFIVYSLLHLLFYLPIYLFIYSFVYLSIFHSFLHSLFYLPIYLFIYSFFDLSIVYLLSTGSKHTDRSPRCRAPRRRFRRKGPPRIADPWSPGVLWHLYEGLYICVCLYYKDLFMCSYIIRAFKCVLCEGFYTSI